MGKGNLERLVKAIGEVAAETTSDNIYRSAVMGGGNEVRSLMESTSVVPCQGPVTLHCIWQPGEHS